MPDIIAADLHRWTKRQWSWGDFAHQFIRNPGFKYVVILRLCQRWPRSMLLAFYKRHLTHKYGIDIPTATKIGAGFKINHFGGIFINVNCVIGQHCSVAPGVILGKGRGGYPTLSDRVYVHAGAKVFGAVTVGHGATVGANAVVTRDVKPADVVGGAPARSLRSRSATLQEGQRA